jgi:hypothetical protein
LDGPLGVLFLVPHHVTPEGQTTTPAPAAAAKPQDRATAVSEAQTFWKSVNSATSYCDQTAAYVTKSINAGDVETIYENGNAANTNCRIAAHDLDKLPLPASAPQNVQNKLKEAIKSLRDGYLSESQNYESLATMANNGIGTAKPSDMASMRQQTAYSQYAKMMGVAKIADAFELEKVKMSDYSGKSGGPHHGHHSKEVD